MSVALRNYLSEERGRATQVAAAVGISRPYLSDISRGKKLPAAVKLLKLAEVTGLSVGAIIGDDHAPVMVPVLSWVSAGHLAEADGVTAEDVHDRVEVADLPPGEWVAFRVDGSSMDRISPPGSVILVNRRERQLVANACYVVADASGSATYKRFRPDPMRLEPVTTLPEQHPTIFFTNPPQVIGRVRRTMLEL